MNVEELNKDLDACKQRGQVGGIKGQETQARRRIFKDILEDLLVQPVVKVDEVTGSVIEKYPGINYAEAVSIAMLRKSMTGDVSAAVFVRDTIGENPKHQVSVEQEKPFEVNINVL